MPFTLQQQNAVDARNPNILISAAAGSGKTTVLIERILSLIKEGYSLDRMLIVTFTRAAAGEMRDRLLKELEASQDIELKKQILTLNRSFICTIDVFCKRVIEEHFQAAGIDALSKIGQQGRLDHFLQLASEDVLESAYLDPTPDEAVLFEHYTDEQVSEAVSQVRGFMLTLDDPDGWAENACDPDPEAKILPLLKEKCRLLLQGAFDILSRQDQLLDLPDGPTVYQVNFDQDREVLQRLKDDLIHDTVIQNGYSLEKLSAKKKGFEGNDPALKEEYKNLRKEIKGIIDEIMSSYPFDPAAIQADLAFLLPSIRAVVHLAQRVQILYDHYKREKNLLDFSDLSRLCVKVLQNDPIREQVASKFDAVFVDECQDVSQIQDYIIHSVLGQKTLFFMVGDVKQSIYRFRQACPKLFQDKYEAFRDDADADERRIILQHNFRSDKNILHCINHIFRYCMRSSVTELNYDEAAMLYPPESAPEGMDVDVVLLNNDEKTPAEETDFDLPDESTGLDPDETVSGGEELSFGYKYEAAYIAKRIQEIVGRMDIPDNGTTRKVCYRDIVILLRKASERAPFIAKLLAGAGIPVFSDADEQYYDLPEIKDVLSVLHVLDNPFQDMPLLAALHCPCFEFTYQELAAIRLRNKSSKVPFHQLFFGYDKEDALGEKIKNTIAKLDEWRFLASQLPLNTFLWRLIMESGLYIRAGAQKNGELRQGNLRLLCEQAGQVEQSHDLHGFLQLVRTSSSSGNTATARTISEKDDVVRIMTMHKSKGLQFPVVFLGELCFNFRSDSPLMMTDSELGCCLRYIDGEKRLKKDTAIRQAFSFRKKKEQLADECRLLYVAMTRAKNKLILVGSPKKRENLIRKACYPQSNYSVFRASCMMDWISAPLADALKQDANTAYTDEMGGRWQLYDQNCS